MDQLFKFYKVEFTPLPPKPKPKLKHETARGTLLFQKICTQADSIGDVSQFFKLIFQINFPKYIATPIKIEKIFYLFILHFRLNITT